MTLSKKRSYEQLRLVIENEFKKKLETFTKNLEKEKTKRLKGLELAVGSFSINTQKNKPKSTKTNPSNQKELSQTDRVREAIEKQQGEFTIRTIMTHVLTFYPDAMQTSISTTLMRMAKKENLIHLVRKDEAGRILVYEKIKK